MALRLGRESFVSLSQNAGRSPLGGAAQKLNLYRCPIRPDFHDGMEDIGAAQIGVLIGERGKQRLANGDSLAVGLFQVRSLPVNF